MIALIAAVILATSPATFEHDVMTAPAGSTLTLAPGTYLPIYLRNTSARTTPLTIDASDPGAVLTDVRFDDSNGVTIKGAHVEGGHIAFNYSHNMKALGVLCTNSNENCVGIGHSTDVLVTDVEIIGSLSDGIDIGASQRVTVRRIVCQDAKPSPGSHPDCVQMYAFKSRNGRPDDAPLSYVTIEHGVAIGNTQGFDMLGNEITADHVVFRDLHVMTKQVWGTQLDDPCTACEMHDVTGWPMRGSQFGVVFTRPHQPPVGSLPSGYTNNSVDQANEDRP